MSMPVVLHENVSQLYEWHLKQCGSGGLAIASLGSLL